MREQCAFPRHKHESWPKRGAFIGCREGVGVCRVSAQVARAWTEKERAIGGGGEQVQSEAKKTCHTHQRCTEVRQRH